jgi:O-antigen/teichoic acid export membrane protein
MACLVKVKIYFNEMILSKVFQNFSWLFFDRIFRLIVGFFVSVLVARYLGVESFGKLSYAVAYAALFQAISNFGVDSIDQMLASLIIIFSILFSVGNVVDLLFQSQSLSKLTVLAKFKSYIICIAIKVTVLLFSLDAIFIFISISLEALLSSIFIFKILYKTDSNIKIDFLHFDLDYVLKLIRESWPLAVSSISIIVFMKSGIFFIENNLGFDAVGIYSVGVSLAEISYVFPVLLLTSFAPVIAKAKAKSNEEYLLKIKEFFRIMYFGSLFGTLIYCLIGYFSIPYVYGDDYDQSKYVFAIHVMTLVPVALGCAQSNWLVNEKKTKVMLYQTLSAAFLNIVLNVFLIEYFGVIGAAVATLLTQIFQTLLINFFFCRALFKLTWEVITFR